MSALALDFKLHFEKSSPILNERLSGRRFVFNKDGKEYYPFGEWEEGAGGILEGITPLQCEAIVASTDSSCILIGETSDGSAYAVRGAVVFARGGSVESFLRIGPMIVYLSPKGVVGLQTPMSGYELKVSLSDHQIAERTIRNSVEKRIIGSLLAVPQEMIVMADGSLKHPTGALSDFTHRFSNSSSCLIGFSKSSSLVSSSSITNSLSRARAASFGLVEDGPVKTVLAKFSPDGLVFRLDIVNRRERIADVLGKVSWNDGFTVGYPESLRLAHHLSVFTRSEDAALKAYLTKQYSLKHLPTFGLRKMALGSFGSGRGR
jgi:hypothetical protein